MGTARTLLAVALLALPSSAAAAAEPWREESVVAALFRQAGVEGTFVLLDERSDTLRGTNRARAEQRFSPASTFKIANALIGLSLGAVRSVDELIPYTGDANPFMREWLEPMGLRGAMKVSNVPLYQELARYCHVRPHSSLGGRTPSEVYTEAEPCSSRPGLAMSGAGTVQ